MLSWEAALMFRAVIFGLVALATMTTMTVAATVIGTAAATYAIGRATMAVTPTPAATQWPARYVGRFVSPS
jgi:hypothetical protein